MIAPAPNDEFPQDSYRPTYDRAVITWELVRDRRFSFTLTDVHSEVQHLAGKCSQRTVRRTLLLLTRLGLLDRTNGGWEVAAQQNCRGH